jgi:hypothetical protein
MTTDDFCFYLQNCLIQTSQRGQRYSDTSPFSIPCFDNVNAAYRNNVDSFVAGDLPDRINFGQISHDQACSGPVMPAVTVIKLFFSSSLTLQTNYVCPWPAFFGPSSRLFSKWDTIRLHLGRLLPYLANTRLSRKVRDKRSSLFADNIVMKTKF